MTESSPILLSARALSETWCAAASTLPRRAMSVSDGADRAREASFMSDEALLEVAGALLATQRALDALRVVVAGEIVHRSDPARGEAGLAKAHGRSRPHELIGELWRVSVGEAHRLCAVGAAARPRFQLSGEPLPPDHAPVAEAVSAGTLGVDAAATIIRHLDEASRHGVPLAAEEAERLLVERADDFSVPEVGVLARQVRDRLDADGGEPRDELRRRRRCWRMSTGSDGTVRIAWTLPPESAGLVKAAVDALVGEELRRTREAERQGGADRQGGAEHNGTEERQGAAERSGTTDGQGAARDAEVDRPALRAAGGARDEAEDPSGGGRDECDSCDGGPDERSLDQMRADAALEVFRHVAGCAGAGRELPTVTMVVRVSLDDLVAGRGSADIDGVGETVSVSTARELAAEAELIPMVLGGAGEVLDVGRGRRLFTRAQRLAFGERDGGCAFGGCSAPPAYTDAHHIRWWSREGRSDLDNGVLLCRFHHHRVHDGGWRVGLDGGRPVFEPPPWLPRMRFRSGGPDRPGHLGRPGGRVRFEDLAGPPDGRVA